MSEILERGALIRAMHETDGRLEYECGRDADLGLCLFDSDGKRVAQVPESLVWALIGEGVLAEGTFIGTRGTWRLTEGGLHEARRAEQPA